MRDDLRLALGALGVTPEPEGKSDGDKQEKAGDVVKGEEEEGRGEDKGETVSSTLTGQPPVAAWAKQVDFRLGNCPELLSPSIHARTPINPFRHIASSSTPALNLKFLTYCLYSSRLWRRSFWSPCAQSFPRQSPPCAFTSPLKSEELMLLNTHEVQGEADRMDRYPPQGITWAIWRKPARQKTICSTLAHRHKQMVYG